MWVGCCDRCKSCLFSLQPFLAAKTFAEGLMLEMSPFGSVTVANSLHWLSVHIKFHSLLNHHQCSTTLYHKTISTCLFSFVFLSWSVFVLVIVVTCHTILLLRGVVFFSRPHADVPSILKCSCHNPYMRLGETLATDIILSVTDKHGNKTGKVSTWDLKLFFDFSLCFAAW